MKPVFLIALMMNSTPITATASDVCMEAQEMEASLIDWYGEAPVDGANSAKLQMWASEATGTWTLVQYFPDGNSCVVAQGDNWTDGQVGEQLLAGLHG